MRTSGNNGFPVRSVVGSRTTRTQRTGSDVFPKLPYQEHMNDFCLSCGTPKSNRLSNVSKWHAAQVVAKLRWDHVLASGQRLGVRGCRFWQYSESLGCMTCGHDVPLSAYGHPDSRPPGVAIVALQLPIGPFGPRRMGFM